MPSKRRRTATAPLSLFAFQDIVTSVTGIMLLIAMTMAIQVASAPARESVETVEESDRLLAEIVAVESEIDRLKLQLADAEQMVAATSSSAPGVTADEIAALRREVEREQAAVAALSAGVERAQAAQTELKESVAQAAKEAGLDDLQAEIEAARRQIVKLKNSNRLLFNKPKNMRGPVGLIELFPEEARVATLGVAAPPAVFHGGGRVTKTQSEVRSRPAGTHWVVFAHPGTTEELSSLRRYFADRRETIGFDLLPDSVVVIDLTEGAP